MNAYIQVLQSYWQINVKQLKARCLGLTKTNRILILASYLLLEIKLLNSPSIRNCPIKTIMHAISFVPSIQVQEPGYKLKP